ncbi:MAG: hypothetical protein NVS9B15_11840 [Acidobacteriaceae bacterium]
MPGRNFDSDVCVIRDMQPKLISMFGVEIRVLTGDLASDTSTVLDYRAPAQFRGPAEHFHVQSSEWFYVLEGALALSVNGEERVAEVGEYLLVRPRTAHRWSNPFDAPVRYLCGFDRPGMQG